MNRKHAPLASTPRRSGGLSRRNLLTVGTAVGAAGAFGLPFWGNRVAASPAGDPQHDIQILNKALFYEHQAIWAYGAAASKLTETAVGKAVLSIALANQGDHKKHRDTLAMVVSKFGGHPGDGGV
ncbi:ferritin-like domain-containing protein [Neosynechococcus sphagnicola]|uniref:ferritin-like domain-containing protein n=1 Tax=Neosynechococcus sphagnicola TaxID=1501145 RepID=UPI001EF9E451|nr:ferritin-like domain-containing protein [Neosynechococcus sphagnicola]